MEFPRRICGGVRRVVVTEEQRYSPRRLRVNDDDSTGVWIQLAPHLSDSQLAATEWLSTALVDSSVTLPLPLAHSS